MIEPMSVIDAQRLVSMLQTAVVEVERARRNGEASDTFNCLSIAVDELEEDILDGLTGTTAKERQDSALREHRRRLALA